jgi:hypothetical protein
MAGRSSRGTWALRHGIERYNNKKSGNQRIKRKKLDAASFGTFPELPPGTITAQPADFSTWPPNS